MKIRIFCLILCLCLLLSGCGFFGERIREPVTFYYLCTEYRQELCCVVVSEEREASGHQHDLPYLMALYLMGPSDEEHTSPLPAGTAISAKTDGRAVHLELTGTAASLSELDYSLACACLTMTVLDNTDAQTVIVRCGERVKTMNAGSLTLYDTVAETTPTEETP